MGIREQLLDGARRCLAERGYARTTVRDIVAATGTNLAAINYHFGTKDALLNQALMESAAEAVDRVLHAVPADADAAGRLRDFLDRLTRSFVDDQAMWTTNVEAVVQAAHSPEVRAQLAAGQVEAREGLADLLPAPDGDDRTRQAMGAVHMTLLTGLLVQWMIDPDRAPGAEQLLDGLRAVGDALRPAADQG
ncbi:transcriptional regulator, TetR family [Streptoalloteichus tenebrarius]|uniref:Transcriptional regulator, TetR family n=1 Tax=Streptoalloteichus tenebrarius (strain ATCC 17920 / DSM 40477 / JCM 4838 / CBS 697.72 / NBRC 16177 / NCIMB 11028 / NRRL B-12390 / A12253. 1 / ISP 5477) TaxID=1933 RepID=A0ABT1HQ66_STRSD|nr:TetR/AcrR family transcriptional regulator [Streptoalloteichus tenebrarius]MCP2257657.1 transcriptional regulator, TetR family [Streptoalloteichus tenebrarius]BFE98619.1 TetR/AcrR family transcriptional regulator [Streptoalloteichus tenebrarius]